MAAGDADRSVLERTVRVAARALGRAGLVHAYGHCSVRLDGPAFLVCPARPMALVKPGEPASLCRVDEPLPDGVLGEVRIHQAIYARRPEINGICRIQPFCVMALSAGGATPVARHGFGAYFGAEIPLFPSSRLVRDDDAAALVATTMGDCPAVVLRGNGAVVAASSLERAVVLSWYLEDAAKVELAVRSAGLDARLSDGEIAERAAWTGRIAERMWEYLTAGDPEV